MDITHILEELAFDMGQLPREAIEAAIVNKEKITPHLLEILENAVEQIDDIIEYDNYQGHLHAMYILAQFREPKAYPLILNLLSFPGEITHNILGDVLTEDVSRILASVCCGNIIPMQRLLESQVTNEYVRAALQSTLVILVGCGLKSRNEVVKYFSFLFQNKLEKRPSFVWDNLVACACELYPEELVDDISTAYQGGLVDPCFISLEDVGNILTENKQLHLFNLLQKSELIEDAVTEMEKWLTLSEGDPLAQEM